MWGSRLELVRFTNLAVEGQRLVVDCDEVLLIVRGGYERVFIQIGTEYFVFQETVRVETEML